MNSEKADVVQSPKVGCGLQLNTAFGDESRSYFLHIPNNCSADSPVFIAVHGIRGDASEIASYFLPFAKQMGCVLVAPLFSRDVYFDYMRLACDERGFRPDVALTGILEEVRELTGVTTNRYHMFGFSGGGQFVHRYLMAFPEQVERAVVASPGWYTFPDINIPFPHGLGQVDTLPDLQFMLPDLLSVPVSVLVGEHDLIRDDTFMKGKRLDHGQGVNRAERGQRWVRQMNATAQAYNIEPCFEFHLLPRSGHSFEVCMGNGRMGEKVFEFLFDDYQR